VKAFGKEWSKKEIPAPVQKLYDESLTQGRDVLAQADESEKQKWLSRDGTDWSGAFGEDPAKIADNSSGTEAKLNENMSTKSGAGTSDSNTYYNSDSSDSDDESDLGLRDGDNIERKSTATEGGEGSGHGSNWLGQVKEYNENKKGMHRKQRGLMQWKPMRNLAFAKNEAKYAARRTFKMGSLSGRQPDVETETT